MFSGEFSGWGLPGQDTAVADSPFIGTTTGTIRTQSGPLVRHIATFVVRFVNQTNFESDSSPPLGTLLAGLLTQRWT